MELLNLSQTVLFVLSIIYGFLIISFIIGWQKLKIFKPTFKNVGTKVSVIIAARNEEALIERTIQNLIAQSYPESLREIIFIDDHSADNTAQIIKKYESFGVKLIQLHLTDSINSYKKMAIQTAIEGCEGDLIITTDADCRMGKDWLATIVNYYDENGFKLISSPVAYFEEQNAFENLQSLEFSYLIGMGASTIGNKMPSTCNGANLAYEKSTFYEVGGFKGIDDLASGDDELLLHKIAEKYPNQIGFLKNEKAVVYTYAKESLNSFLQQRKRWASKSTRYKNKSIIVLGVLIWLYNLALLTSFILSLFLPEIRVIVFYSILFKIAIEILFISKIVSFFNRPKLMNLTPILSLLHILYMVYIGVAGNSGNYNWKGRSVK